MFTLQEFKRVCMLFGTYTANEITPIQVMQRLRLRNKKREIEVLSDAFERLPGYSQYTIQEFIDILRMKTLVGA